MMQAIAPRHTEDTDLSRTPATQPTRPQGLWGLAFVEMWERYSFYGIQAILTLYLVATLNEGGLGLSPLATGGLVGGYGGAVYLAQLLGAWFGERVIAPRTMVLHGAAIICLGHVVLALVPGLTGLGYGLGLIVLGTGCLKSNITSIVGLLYAGRPQGERDAGFSYFYMGISIGAVLGPLTTGFAQTKWGFHIGFAAAAVVMFASLIQYLVVMRTLPQASRTITSPLPKTQRAWAVALVLVALGALALTFEFGLLPAEQLSLYVTCLVAVGATAYFITMLRSERVDGSERRRVAGFIPVFIGSSLFFGLLFQIFTTAPLFALDSVDLSIAGWSFPIGWIGALSTGTTVLAAPILAQLWIRLGRRQPSAPGKVALGLGTIGVAFALLAIFSFAFGSSSLPLVLLLLCMIIIGSSEILVGPVGLSLASRIGPRHFSSQMVGLNFLSLSLGSTLAGSLSQLYSTMSGPTFFALNSGASLILGAALWASRRKLSGMMSTGLPGAV